VILYRDMPLTLCCAAIRRLFNEFQIRHTHCWCQHAAEMASGDYHLRRGWIYTSSLLGWIPISSNIIYFIYVYNIYALLIIILILSLSRLLLCCAHWDDPAAHDILYLCNMHRHQQNKNNKSFWISFFKILIY
jgi:hypothetical protein